MDGWIDKQIDVLAEGLMDRQMEGIEERLTGRWTSRQIDWIDGKMNER